jgi:superfamily I DNA and RNA helicase
LRKAAAHNQTAMYICFNRALVDSVKLSAPNPKNCWTFHELARFVAESQGQVFDFGDETAFKRMVDYFLSNYADLKEQLDVLVIDEGQDFYPEWGAVLLELIKPEGRMIWLEDSSQRIYGRPSIEPEGWVKLSSPTNYRSPQHVLTLINGLNLTDDYLETGNGYAGLAPGHFVYQDGNVIETTALAVQDLIEQGFAPESIAVLSFHGAKNSVFLSDKVEKINGFSIKKSTGYDQESNATWSNGELLVDTLYRFKGQCADAIVLTEIDFTEWDQVTKNKLFVGLTRARLTINLVMSTVVEKLFIAKGFS